MSKASGIQAKTRVSEKSRINYYVLIAADSDRNRLNMPSAFQLANYRLKRKEWGLKERTRYRRHFRAGDKVLIYISGHRENAQHFVACATIAGSPAPAQNAGGSVDAPTLITSIFSEYKVKLNDIGRFAKPVSARDLLTRFRFVAPKYIKMWRIYFQGGAAKITKSDFTLVLRNGGILLSSL
jgi:hypothetical protein